MFSSPSSPSLSQRHHQSTPMGALSTLSTVASTGPSLALVASPSAPQTLHRTKRKPLPSVPSALFLSPSSPSLSPRHRRALVNAPMGAPSTLSTSPSLALLASSPSASQMLHRGKRNKLHAASPVRRRGHFPPLAVDPESSTVSPQTIAAHVSPRADSICFPAGEDHLERVGGQDVGQTQMDSTEFGGRRRCAGSRTRGDFTTAASGAANAPAPAPSTPSPTLKAAGKRICGDIKETEAHARTQAKVEAAREHWSEARRVWEERCALTRRGRRNRLGFAEDQVSRAIVEHPSPEAAWFKFRSLVRATQLDFDDALSDALRAEQLSETGRSETLLREGRALTGLGRVDEAAQTFVRALDRAPTEERLSEGFVGLLPAVQRHRFYWPAPRAPRPERERHLGHGFSERLFEEPGHVEVRLPSEPQYFKVVRGEATQAGKWLLSWAEPADDGDDEIYEYLIELRHENYFDPTGPFTEPAVLFRLSRSLTQEFDVNSLKLLPSTPIELSLRARNEKGYGPAAIFQAETPARERAGSVKPLPPDDWRDIDVHDLLKEIEKRFGIPVAVQFDELHAVWADNVVVLRVLFRLSCLRAASCNSSSLTRMAFDQFLAFAKALGVLGEELTRGEMQLIFVRGNINRANDGPNDRPGNDVKSLDLAEFVGCVSRMAADRLPHLQKDGGLALQTRRFITTYLDPHVKALRADEDAIWELLEQRDVQLVLYRHRPRVSIVFGAYASLGLPSAARARLGIVSQKQMNQMIGAAAIELSGGEPLLTTGGAEAFLNSMSLTLESWLKMLREGGMLDATFSQKEATETFVRVNIYHLLFGTWLRNEGERGVRVAEFELMVARLTRLKVKNAGEPFASTLDAFLTMILVPTYRRILKERGITIPTTDDVKRLPAVPRPMVSAAPDSSVVVAELSKDLDDDHRLG